MSYLVLALFAVMLPDGSSDCVALQFKQSQCSTCQSMQPAVETIAEHGWAIRQVDITENPAMAARYRISQIPTTIILRRGKEVDRVVGAISALDLHQRLASSGSIAARQNARLSAATQNELSSGNRFAGNQNTYANQSPNAYIQHATIRGQSQTPSEVMMASANNYSASSDNYMASTVQPASYAQPNHSPSHQQYQTAPPRISDGQRAVSTVRIRVDDPRTQSVGTGTIIASQGGTAAVITCGHLFRDAPADSQIIVEYWSNGQMQQSLGQLVDFQAAEVDIGLIVFQPRANVATSPIVPANFVPAVGQSVYSVGCDHGEDPTVRNSQVSKINRFLGPQNIETTGAPVQGRSGGGLFTEEGYLIGVCYAADNQLGEGLYAGPQVIADQLARAGMSNR